MTPAQDLLRRRILRMAGLDPDGKPAPMQPPPPPKGDAAARAARDAALLRALRLL
jgi:hypothetical protein